MPVLQSKFAFFGRIDTLKGIHLFIEAVEIVLAIPLDSEFRGLTGVAIVGNYPLDKKKTQNEEKIEELFSKLRARGIQVEQYNDLMTVEAIDVLRENGYVAVLPSLYENYPMALLEMLSYGVLVIHADAGGQSEVSMNNNNMFRGGDPRDLARFMERAMRDGMIQDTTALSREEVYDGYERVVRIDPHKLRRGAQVAHTQVRRAKRWRARSVANRAPETRSGSRTPPSHSPSFLFNARSCRNIAATSLWVS